MRLATAVRLTAALAVTIVPAIPQAASAAFPGRNGRIVFQTFKGELLSISPKGRDLRRVVPGSRFGDFGPSVAPDGRTVVFSRARAEGGDDLPLQLFTAPLSGGAAQPLQLFGRQPAFSGPDGGRLAFQDYYRPKRLALADADGSDPELLTRAGGRTDDDPAFSPNGRTVAFDAAHRKGGSEILRINADGSRRRRLTSTKGGASFGPSFSPDGRWIAFTRYDRASDRRSVWIMRRNGHGLHRLTRASRDSSSPAISPNGSKVVFVRERGRRTRLVVIDRDGGHERPLTNAKLNAEEPDWAVR